MADSDSLLIHWGITNNVYTLTLPSIMCQAFSEHHTEGRGRVTQERDMKRNQRWVRVRQSGRYSEAVRIRHTPSVIFDGLSIAVHMEFLLRAELPRLAEHRPTVSVSARLCFRNSLCSSLESLYLLPPQGRTRRWTGTQMRLPFYFV